MRVHLHKPVRLLRLKEVLSRVSLSRSTVNAKIAAGKFPRPVSLGARAIAWHESDIDAWINECGTPDEERIEEAAAEWGGPNRYAYLQPASASVVSTPPVSAVPTPPIREEEKLPNKEIPHTALRPTPIRPNFLKKKTFR